jgi:hypothetical protein
MRISAVGLLFVAASMLTGCEARELCSQPRWQAISEMV